MTPSMSRPVEAQMQRLQERLMAEHVRIEAACNSMLSAFKRGEWAEVQQQWGVLETSLEAHMREEENEILPAFAQAHAQEAAGIAQEHASLRAKLAELGVAVDLHLARLDRAQELMAEVKHHAERENRLLYQWVGASSRTDFGALPRASTVPPVPAGRPDRHLS